MKMEEWKECKLGDVVEIHRGASPRPIQKFIANSGMPWVKISDATASNSRFIDSTKEFIIEDGISKSVIVNPEDLIVSNSATPGLPKIMKIKACIHDGWLYFSNYKNISRDFLYYKFFDIQRHLTNLANGSVFQNLKTDIVKDFTIKLPPLTTQQKIAAILSSLDDKIELNNKINANLEQQAQAIFKSWFVDFEPFGGKMPEGWKEIALENLCTVITKGTTPTTLGKKFTDTGINFIKGESILENHTFDLQKISHIDEDTNTLLKRSIIQPEDILFTIAGTLGRFAMIDESLTPANTNQAVGIIRADKSKISPYFLYSIFIGNWHNDYYTKRIQQAVQANLSLGTIKSLPIIIPDKNNLEKYNNLIEPIFKQMKQLENENIKLSTLRDTLLPKLMNGEIKTNSIIIDKEMKNV